MALLLGSGLTSINTGAEEVPALTGAGQAGQSDWTAPPPSLAPPNSSIANGYSTGPALVATPESLPQLIADHAGTEEAAEARVIRGLLDLTTKDKEAAKARWHAVVDEHPESRWAWQAAAFLRSTMLDVDVAPDFGWPGEDVVKEVLVFDESTPLPADRAAEAADGGTFEVRGPDGFLLRTAGGLPDTGTVGSAYSNEIAFTLLDGATDFAEGDSFTVTGMAIAVFTVRTMSRTRASACVAVSSRWPANRSTVSSSTRTRRRSPASTTVI